MTDRLSKIITRKGDDGNTSLNGKDRISKNSPRIEALGSLDELNCAIGVMLSYLNPTHQMMIQVFEAIQNQLFDAGSEICPPYRFMISNTLVKKIETTAKKWNANLTPLKEFILPRGNLATTHCHLARAICRRTERVLVGLNLIEKINPALLRYINRLSDLLFITARILKNESKTNETFWHPNEKFSP